jgi:hypothetical protein
MTKDNFVYISAVVFLGVSLLNCLRLLYDWGVIIGHVVVPGWVSWVTVFLAAYLTFQGFILGKRS